MKLDKRQKFIFGLIVLAVIILIWQMYSLFGGESALSPSASKTQTITSLKEVASPTQVVQTPVSSKKSQPAMDSGKLSPEQIASQQQYLALVNEYQVVEIQRLIAQDQAAIAAARAATAESLAKISQSGGSAGSLASSIVAANNQPGDYELIYTGQDNGEWSATLKRNGQFNDVTAGSVLPDGDKVLSVDDNGVLIQEGDIKKLVTFNGVTPVDDKPQADQQVNSPQTIALQSQLQTPAKPVEKKTQSTQVTKSETKQETKSEIKQVVLPAPVPILEQVKPSVLPKVVATNAPAAANSSDTNFDITKANKKSYTLQIVSDNNLNAIKAFVADNHLTNQAQIVKILRYQKPWYIVVMGEYATRSAATAAINKLPDPVQDEEPFPRRVEDVQSKMVK